jgi:hypothetical protein
MAPRSLLTPSAALNMFCATLAHWLWQPDSPESKYLQYFFDYLSITILTCYCHVNRLDHRLATTSPGKPTKPCRTRYHDPGTLPIQDEFLTAYVLTKKLGACPKPSHHGHPRISPHTWHPTLLFTKLTKSDLLYHLPGYTNTNAFFLAITTVFRQIAKIIPIPHHLTNPIEPPLIWLFGNTALTHSKRFKISRLSRHISLNSILYT